MKIALNFIDKHFSMKNLPVVQKQLANCPYVEWKRILLKSAVLIHYHSGTVVAQ